MNICTTTSTHPATEEQIAGMVQAPPADYKVKFHPIWKGIKGVKVVHKRYDIVTTSPSRNWELCEDVMWLLYH